MTNEGYQPCIDEDCPDYAMWRLDAADAAYRPPQVAFACDNQRHLLMAVGKIFDNLLVCAGTINFQVQEEGFPVTGTGEGAG